MSKEYSGFSAIFGDLVPAIQGWFSWPKRGLPVEIRAGRAEKNLI
jgi:hypothetical protein